MKALRKPANTACVFQKFHKGCTIYHDANFPAECGTWSCRWLVAADTDELPRPDRSRYVLDIMPDFVTTIDNETGARQNIQVVQVWVDPKHRDAHRDPALRRYLERRAREGIAAIIRFSASEAIVLIAPPVSDGQWHEYPGNSMGRDHTPREVVQMLSQD